MNAVTQILVGPRRHGVVEFGLALHAALRHGDRPAALRLSDGCHLIPSAADIAESRLVHTQFTDRLFGVTPRAAAAAFTALADVVHAGGSAVTTTLHDLPQPADGVNHADRVRAYRAVVAACDAVVVSSRHERDLLRESRIEHSPWVIPLPLSPPATHPAPRTSVPTSLGVFGYVYPGKGHTEVLAAAAGLPGEVQLHILGTASTGHEDLIGELHSAAARQRRTLVVTGHIADIDLIWTLRAVTVPVTAHRHVSASGSLNTWLSAGRRPLAPATRYTAEIEQRNPGCLQLFSPTPSGLLSGLRRALRNPDSTWLPARTRLNPSPAEAASAYAEMFKAVAR